MFDADQYSLLDFGRGRKLERFGNRVVDRPAPAAVRVAPAHSAPWKQAADVCRRGSAGFQWQSRTPVPPAWSVRHDSVVMELSLGPHGQVGVFPEQAENWDWIAACLKRRRRSDRPANVLNLFAYTGGSTLAAASHGAQVVHVDAAKASVARARRNARLSGLAAAPIRWIVDDAAAFVAREVRRGRRYDGLILDPPTYGHGPSGRAWNIARDLPPLLAQCAQVFDVRRGFFLLTCHTPQFGAAELEALLSDAVFGRCGAGVRAAELHLESADHRRLSSGVAARWPG